MLIYKMSYLHEDIRKHKDCASSGVKAWEAIAQYYQLPGPAMASRCEIFFFVSIKFCTTLRNLFPIDMCVKPAKPLHCISSELSAKHIEFPLVIKSCTCMHIFKVAGGTRHKKLSTSFYKGPCTQISRICMQCRM